MKKKDEIRNILLTVSLSFVLTASSLCIPAAADDQHQAPVRKIIIDTDTGADDAAAMILAASSPEVEIMGVTVLAGNVGLEQSTKNALATLELADCDVPVYKGSDTRYDGTAISPHSVFGKDGMGDKDLIHPKGTAEEEDAVNYILDTFAAIPEKLRL